MHEKRAHASLAWITAGLGLAVMVINFINRSILNSFLKKQPIPLDHAYIPHFPAEELLFLINPRYLLVALLSGCDKGESSEVHFCAALHGTV